MRFRPNHGRPATNGADWIFDDVVQHLVFEVGSSKTRVIAHPRPPRSFPGGWLTRVEPSMGPGRAPPGEEGLPRRSLLQVNSGCAGPPTSAPQGRYRQEGAGENTAGELRPEFRPEF